VKLAAPKLSDATKLVAGLKPPAAAPPRRPRLELDALCQSLYAVEGQPFTAPAWLADAAADPAAFWRDIAPALTASVAGSSRSSLFERYQLAHDLGARHAVDRRPAFISHDAAGFAATSYTRLVAGAKALAGTWRARGVGPGGCVAIVAPISAELVTALLAAWHLGAVAAPLPVWGRTYIRDRIAALAPDFVATSRARALWLDIDVELRLPTAALEGEATAGLAHLYAPDEPALRVFSPLGDAPLEPFDVPAERMYLGALRDGAMFFGLGAELGLTAPGFCEVQLGLPLLLACLATGAHFVQLSLDDACQRPELVCSGRIHVVGVHPQLRDALAAGDPSGSGPPRWFRSPATAHDPDRWSRLATARPFSRSLGACYAASPVAGGAITWSPWRRSPMLNTVLPAPGLDWQLLDPGRGGAVCFDGNGILTSTAAPIEAIGQPLLGRLAGEQLWVASIGAHRDGQRLPAPEIEAIAATRPEVWTSALVDDPRAGAVLIVFARPDRMTDDQAARDALAGELAELIDLELAPHLTPPRIEVFTVAPHIGDDGALDRDWCRGQHISGRLSAKQREPMFPMIAALRLALSA
jgi:hypothetical protein